MARRFPYIRLHVRFPSHPKNAELTDAAFRVQVTALCYSQEHLTDGFVPENIARGWSRKGVRELVAKVRWAKVDGGYLIHDFLEWNDSRGEVEGKSQKKSMAGAMGAATRWHGKPDSNGDGGSHREHDGAIALVGGSKSPTTPQGARPEIERLCTRLADLIEANGVKRPTISAGWRDAARLMLDRDGRSEAEVDAVVAWAQADEFWRANVLSMGAVRKQFDRLTLQMRRGHSPSRHPTDRRVRELLERSQ